MIQPCTGRHQDKRIELAIIKKQILEEDVRDRNLFVL
jgi:hypothetical protein